MNPLFDVAFRYAERRMAYKIGAFADIYNECVK